MMVAFFLNYDENLLDFMLEYTSLYSSSTNTLIASITKSIPGSSNIIHTPYDCADTTPFNLQRTFKSTRHLVLGHCFQSSKADALIVAVLNLYQSLTKAYDLLNTHLKILEDNEYFQLWLKVSSIQLVISHLLMNLGNYFEPLLGDKCMAVVLMTRVLY